MTTTVTSGFQTFLLQVPLLDSTNWFTWKNEMEMLLTMEDMDKIVLGTETKDKAQDKDAWEKADKKAKVAIYFRIDPQYRPLFQGHFTSSALWAALKSKFQANTATRIDALEKLYTTLHDPSQPVGFYIQALKSARGQLTAITGEDIKDQHFIDVLLMNLHSDFSQIRTSILSQATEPTLDQVLSILTKSQDILTSSIVKQESVLFVCPKPQSGSGGSQSYPVDDKGFKWCDTKREGACHRCGRPGHIAVLCIINMPEHVKDWVLHKPKFAHISDAESEVAHLSHTFSSVSPGPLLI